MWITEIKSGELHSGKNSNETSIDLIGTAKRDLLERLENTTRSLWINAVNGARNVYEKHNDLKDAILEILENLGENAETDMAANCDTFNVFLVSALFAPLLDKIDCEVVGLQATSISSNRLFNGLYIMCIQKETFEKVYEFLEGESVNE